MGNTKSKFLNISKKYKFLKRFYYFYNIYIRNYKFLNNGSQFGEDKFILNKFKKIIMENFLILAVIIQQSITILIFYIRMDGQE